MSDLYKIKNGKRIKLTDAEKAQRLAEIEAGKPTTEDIKKEEQAKAKLERNIKLSQTTVEINGKVFWADPESEHNFQGRIREMELSGKTGTKWIQGVDVFEATLEELKEVVNQGTKLNAAHFDEYIAKIEALRGE